MGSINSDINCSDNIRTNKKKETKEPYLVQDKHQDLLRHSLIKDMKLFRSLSVTALTIEQAGTAEEIK